jgi:predicted nucleic acid-binding protein
VLERRHARGLVDTSVIIEPPEISALDLLIAATPAAEGLPLYTRNPDDFAGLHEIVEVVVVSG